MRPRAFLVAALVALHGPVFGQGRSALTPTGADSLYRALIDRTITVTEERLAVSDQLIAYFRQERRPCELARTLVSQAGAYDALGRLDAAIRTIQEAETTFQSSCDSSIHRVMRLQLTNIYLSMGDADRVISVAEDILRTWRAGDKEVDWRYMIMQNMAIAYDMRGDRDKAGQTFLLVYRESKAANDKVAQLDGLVNLGSFKANRGDLDSASACFENALMLAQELNSPEQIHGLTINLALLRSDLGAPEAGLQLLDQAEARAKAMNNLQYQAEVERHRAYIHSKHSAWKAAFEHQSTYLTLRDSMLNEEMYRAVADVREKYETEKKAKENETLRATNLEVELDRARVKRFRNILWLGLSFAVIFASVFLLQRNRISKEKKRSEELLLNILPAEVAEELKAKGEAEAKLIDEVTVLFTDFKGFTTMSETLSAHDLVRDLNECFSAFDRITERHGIEKIKTIGDAYMAAGGLPTPNTTHASDVIHAALEIRDFITQGKQRKLEQGLPYFEIRIGIHTGPVVAGIVGVKKFQYDIWGDTVNTASRLESSDEVGQVNISEATYALVKNEPGLSFTPRGKVQAKGKGELEMYFVRRSHEAAA